MSHINDGGQAFPTSHINGDITGMTLRKWFAGQIISTAYNFVDWHGEDLARKHAKRVAKNVVLLADALIAELEQPK